MDVIIQKGRMQPEAVIKEIERLEKELTKTEFKPWIKRVHELLKSINKDSQLIINETKEGFYFNLPKDRFFILRKLSGKWYHLYHNCDGMIPRSYKTKEGAEEYINRELQNEKILILNGLDASKYPVPKRY